MYIFTICFFKPNFFLKYPHLTASVLPIQISYNLYQLSPDLKLPNTAGRLFDRPRKLSNDFLNFLTSVTGVL